MKVNRYRVAVGLLAANVLVLFGLIITAILDGKIDMLNGGESPYGALAFAWMIPSIFFGMMSLIFSEDF